MFTYHYLYDMIMNDTLWNIKFIFKRLRRKLDAGKVKSWISAAVAIY